MKKTITRAFCIILTIIMLLGSAPLSYNSVDNSTSRAFSVTAQAASKIHLKKKTITLTAGKTYTQKLIGKNGKAISSSKVKWKSSNSKIAKISKKGKVTAVKKGTVKLTATYKGKKYSFTVKVNKKTSKKTTSSNKTTATGVYRTPYGKRYHFDAQCGGKNSYSITLKSAKASGLTPCSKCAK